VYPYIYINTDSNLRKIHYILFLIVLPFNILAQIDTVNSKLSFAADFRFRVEQDFNSRKSDATYRDDRTRLRYRLRAGFNYQLNSWAFFGARLRTGYSKKQQDAQLTLGDGFKEFGTLPIGFEKAFFKAEQNGFVFWAGKNTFPFKKQNELFWSDNVSPEGVFLKKKIPINSKFINQFNLSGGYFIINTKGKSLDKDSYFQGLQLNTNLFNNRLILFPSFYIFKNIQNIPDGNETFLFDYSIFHLGTSIKLLENPTINFEADYYLNLENYSANDSIPTALKNQKKGLVSAISIGKLKKRKDWMFKATYSYIQQYAAVDFLAQNDWARWDYSSFGSPDGRLSNFKGIELVGAFMIAKNMSLKMKYYLVEQLVPFGVVTETGNRIRLDLDIKF